MKKQFIHIKFYVAVFFGAAAAGALIFMIYAHYEAKRRIFFAEEELREARERLAAMSDDLAETRQVLQDTIRERDDFANKYDAEKRRMDEFALQIQSIQSTVGVLEKVQNTDEELLKKYSKVYFLNENYVPQQLEKISPAYAYEQGRDLLFHAKALPYLAALMDAATREGVDLKIISAYRSFGEQAYLKSGYTFIYGSGANQFSADQGYSEHQLGTAADFTTKATGANFSLFETTPAYLWLLGNAHRYGFVLSYPEGNTYYKFEPWHWRFVGEDLAQKLYSEGKHFYDLDQRVLDTYLISIFD